MSKMNKYKHFRFEDFIQDKAFRDWVFKGDVKMDYFWAAYLEANPHQKVEIEKGVLFLKNVKETEDKPDRSKQDQLWGRLAESMDEVDKEGMADDEGKVVAINPEYDTASRGLSHRRKLHERKRARSATTVRMIAAAVFLVIFSVSYYFFIQNQPGISPDPGPQVLTSTNPSGQRSNIFLPDGSTVILAAESSISYLSEFPGKERRVELEGEAFFEVIDDPLRPFSVISGKVVTTALGTSFNINSFDEDVQVSLVSGKVLVEVPGNDSTSQVLGPGEQAVYIDAGATLKTTRFDIKLITSCKDGILIFKNSSHQEFFNRLARWYGVQFKFTNQPVENWNYSGEFSGENLENLLKGVGFSKDFDFRINDKSVEVTFK